MNKTVNINLGGIFFHIDEDAFQKLARYFDAIKRSLSNATGQDEIINDIEMRVSELLTEKQKSDKHVVGMKDVDEVIAVMGQPEDYRIDEDGDVPKASSFASNNNGSNRIKKLYRDKDKGQIGGVLAGLSHYFGIDLTLLRVLMLVLFFVFGTGFLLYVILWIAMPEAVTTSEKLEMTGEPVNISNIEKKVREEFAAVSDKIKNTDYEKIGHQFKNEAERVGSGFGDFIIAVLKIFVKFIGGIMALTGFVTVVSLLIAIFTIGTTSFINTPWDGFIESGNYSDYPAWTFGLVMFFAVGIPFFFLTFLGLKLMVPTVKAIGRTAIYTLLAIWLIAVALAISIGIKQASAYAENGRVVEKQNLYLNPTDTLVVKFAHNDFYSRDLNDNYEYRITEDSLKNKIIFSTDVSIKFEATDENQAYVKIEKQAQGSTFTEANDRARAITYRYKVLGNNLIFDNYLITNFKNKFRDQEVEITLYLPKGTVFKCDKSVENYDRSDNDDFNLYDSGNYSYKVFDTTIKCLNCPENEDEDYNVDEKIDIRDDNIDVKINKDGILIKTDSTNANGERQYLKIDKNGVIIKNK